MPDTVLFWHRRDLRLSDNVGLVTARQQSPKVIGVFCLDPQLLERDDVAPARIAYMLESLRELHTRYEQAGSCLLLFQGNPVDVLPKVARHLHVHAVYWNRDVEPYGRERDRQVAAVFKKDGVAVHARWDQLLHHPKEISTGSGTPYSVYTPFWKNWNAREKASPMPELQDMVGLSPQEMETAQSLGAIAIPTAAELGFSWEEPLFLAPGERAAQEQLEWFCEAAIATYDEQRNFPATAGTSCLSAALKFGTIGIRTVWAAAATVFEQSRSDETRQNIQTWQQELAWREFYQHALYWFPELAEGAYREPFKRFPWVNNEKHFQAWCEGRTGYPIVDAAMRQLNQTGWMHNRCRMIVASFLTKDLIIDWRWGERYFMQTLIDGDLAANNGGWQWSASSGMDPKPLRIFNPASQAQKFDPDGEYIRQWLPELRSIDTAALLTGKISKFEGDRAGYPQPIVDHKGQQQKFKQLYAAQKG
jgi:deoxyribodipyrimidine photo-lyase